MRRNQALSIVRPVHVHKSSLHISLQPQLALVRLFYRSNTLFTSITKRSKSIIKDREKWLVLPTPRTTQSTALKIKAQNSVLSGHTFHDCRPKNTGDCKLFSLR